MAETIYAETDIYGHGNAGVKRDVFVHEIENCFSACYTPIGEKKKYKAHISKYVRHILKYLRRIFCLLKTGENNADKSDGRCGVLMSEKTVQKMPLMIFVHKRHS